MPAAQRLKLSTRWVFCDASSAAAEGGGGSSAIATPFKVAIHNSTRERRKKTDILFILENRSSSFSPVLARYPGWMGIILPSRNMQPRWSLNAQAPLREGPR